MAQSENNYYLINAPAGSGKTYFISEEINDILKRNPFSKILCITYTNRASEVMRERIISPDVEISTIHSFFNSFLSPFFQNQKVVDYYFDCFQSDIIKAIKDNSKYYRQSHRIDEELTVEVLKSNLKSLYYNERQYSSILDGGLSHDDLLEFSFRLMNSFPKIGFKLNELYQYIFIDEVQDTSTSVLDFFYTCTKGGNTKVYFLGDKMQEIYNKYDGTFEKIYNTFDTSLSSKFTKNYRSSSEIVNVLNNLYIDKNKIYQTGNKGNIGSKPQMILVNNIEDYLNGEKELYEGYYKLRTINKRRFENIDDNGGSATDVYELYAKIYKYGSKISVMDVLNYKNYEDNSDELMSFLGLVYEIINEYKVQNYGPVIQMIKNAKKTCTNSKSIPVFNTNILKLSRHSDKLFLKEKLDNLCQIFQSRDKMLGVALEELENLDILNKDFYLHLLLFQVRGEFTYTDLFCLPVYQFKLVADYNRKPMVSSQHGVKGEGHKNILFVAEDNNRNPLLKMYEFFELFVKYKDKGFSLNDFQDFYYHFHGEITKLEDDLGKTVSSLNAADRNDNFDTFQGIYNEYFGNIYYDFICRKNCSIELNKKLGLDKFKTLFNKNNVAGVLVAYKLFYVGCSRAEEKLTVVIDRNKIASFEKEFINTFSEIGFEMVER